MDEDKKRALLQQWREWWDRQPEEIIIGGVVLKKQRINGVPVYSAPVDVALWGEKKTMKKKLQEMVADPEAMKVLIEHQKRARETIRHIREASRFNLYDLKKVHYNI